MKHISQRTQRITRDRIVGIEIMKPEVRMELEDNLFGQSFQKHYYCRGCGKILHLGQTVCKCGLPIIWEGIKDWDAMQKKRRKK